MPLSFKGAWNLIDADTHSTTNLYTCKSRDVYIHKQTRKKYLKGEYKIFRKTTPKLIEETDEFEYLIGVEDKPLNTNSYLKELLAINTLK